MFVEQIVITDSAIVELPGSAACQPAIVGSLPTKFVFGSLPNTAGKLPALPGNSRLRSQ
jgi:hypothetical protein